ncbi:MAG: SDR family oxidoreductase [Casimicrobiaceae bacterium]
MKRVEGKVAIVTGGASGLGEADAEALIAEGAHVIITDVNDTLGARVAERIGATFIHHDVASEADWEKVIALAQDRFGKLDVLVNNAAITIPATPDRATLEDFRTVNRVNSEGVFLGCRFGLNAMMKNGGRGSIINLSSMAAVRGFPDFVSYSASKGAVRALSLTVAAHCLRAGYPQIRCNTILPGATLTPQQQQAQKAMAASQPATPPNPRLRVGQPADIAHLVVYLASDESVQITGQEFIVDGGYSIL